jgi:two-component system phosphate regulon sensor histidine kinase PhoR
MTHEFKTPIATINLALDSLKNEKLLADPERLTRYLGIIREENKRMNAHVENVLQISKLERRELELEKEPLDLHDLINDAAEHVSLLLNAREGKITINYGATRSTVLANDSHFTNLLVNILDNAIKYAIDAPEIEVSTENIKDLIIVKIKDHGPGISKSAQSRIFEKFFREHTGNIHNVKGHGLGLAYVKKIIDEHGGEIFVESEKGKGTTFIIKISLIN